MKFCARLVKFNHIIEKPEFETLIQTDYLIVNFFVQTDMGGSQTRYSGPETVTSLGESRRSAQGQMTPPRTRETCSQAICFGNDKNIWVGSFYEGGLTIIQSMHG